jgi:hypothetical protein
MQFLITTRTHWEESQRSRHQVANALSKNNKVYFLAANKIGFPKIRIKEVDHNLTIFVPYWFVSSRIRYRVPLINEMYQLWIFNILRKELPGIIVINFDHTFYLLYKYYKKIVYYCSDEFIGNGRYSNLIVNTYHRFCEKKVSGKSDICIATAYTLLNKLKKHCNTCFEIKLGAPDISNIKRHIDFNRRDEQRKINVGIVGFFNDYSISNSFLEKISNDKHIHLKLIGRYNTKVEKLLGNRVTFIGEKKNEELYTELKSIDVGIAAYSRKANSGTTPNKLWLYLALGKPVVVTNLNTIKNWIFEDKFIYKANNDNEFIKYIYEAYNNDTKELMLRRINFARQNSWEKRIDQLLTILHQYWE